MRALALLVVLLAHAPAPAQQGWSLTLRRFNALENPENAIPERFLLHGHLMKTSMLHFHTIYNLRENTITYLNPANGTYWVGDAEGFAREVRLAREALAGVPDHIERLSAWGPTAPPGSVAPRAFEARWRSRGPAVGGFPTEIYEVYANGHLLQTVWVSADLPISNDFDFAQLNRFLAQLTPGATADSFERSEQYIGLLGKGYPVKVMIALPDGQIYISEVLEARRIDLSPADFAVPNGFTLTTLAEVGALDAME